MELNNVDVIICLTKIDLVSKEDYEKIKEIITKNGEKMMFILGSDEEMQRDFTVFPREYEKYFSIQKGDIVKIKKDYDSHLRNYNFYDKLHVITDIPHKVKNQKFFRIR